MSKIKNAFKDGKAFIGFLTAGDPSIEKSCEYILTMERAGAAKASSSRKPTSGLCQSTRGWKTCSASSKWYGSSPRFRLYS